MGKEREAVGKKGEAMGKKEKQTADSGQFGAGRHKSFTVTLMCTEPE